MKYSFVLIAFNEAANIANCIRSIELLTKLGSDYEILIVDDGSTDATVSKVNKLAISNRHLNLLGDGCNHGRGYGRQLGVNSAKADYIIMVDADIILPKDWLKTVQPYLKTYAAAGGIAVPDGDVAFIHRKYKLKPKTVMGSTTITGNNGIYNKRIFQDINFDPNLREGEDVDFNHRLQRHGFKTICVPGLTVEHQEQKSFVTSMQWLYQSGIGATRQLINFKQIRLPDLAYAAISLSTLLALAATIIFGYWFTLIVPVGLLLASTILHLRSKFYLTLQQPLASARAIAAHAVLMFCYYIGRTTGPFVYLQNRSQVKEL